MATRIPNNHEHLEAHEIDQYVREVMRENGIKQAHKLQSVEIQPDDSLVVRVEIHPLLPMNLPVVVVNIKTNWEGDEGY